VFLFLGELGRYARRRRHHPGVTDLERPTLTFWTAVQRARRMAVPERDKVLVLADREVIYRRERAAIQRSSSSSLYAPKRARDLNLRLGPRDPRTSYVPMTARRPRGYIWG